MINFTNIEELPIILENGYVLGKLPSSIASDINELYLKTKKWTRKEHKEEALCIEGDSEISALARYEGQRDRITQMLLPYHEDIFGYKLKSHLMYGVRTYKKGATLDMHQDKLATHHVGSIVVVDKDLNGEEDWPLAILDHKGKEHRVNINVGDIFYYEAAILPHGRPYPLLGNSYSIIMNHFYFADYQYVPPKTVI